MKDKQRNAAKAMKKSGQRIVLARLSKRGMNTMKQFTKQAQNMLDNVEVGTKTFPDADSRSAARELFGALENTLGPLKAIAEASGDDELVEIVEDMQDAAENLGSMADEPSDVEPSSEESVQIDGLEEVDLGGSELDETGM